MSPSGSALCLSSAAAFGAMGIFGQLAYGAGASVGTLLAVRFGLAALVLWAVVRPSSLPRRDVRLGLGLGVVYGAQAGGYFLALDRLDAGLLALLVHAFPALVAVAAVGLGRERFRASTGVALGLAAAGLVLVLAGTASGDPLGIALGLGTAVVYAGYVLSADGVAARVPPLGLATLVCTGAAATLGLGAVVTGDLSPGEVEPAGWGWLVAIALLSTVGAIGLFLAGLERVGPTAASILSTLEPVVAVALAFVAFGDALSPAQVAGGALVLGAVLVVRVPVRVVRLQVAA